MRLDDYLSSSSNSTKYLANAQQTMSERLKGLTTADGQKFTAFLGSALGAAKTNQAANIGEAKPGFMMSTPDKFKFLV